MENFGGVITPEGGDTKMSAPAVTHPRYATAETEFWGLLQYFDRYLLRSIFLVRTTRIVIIHLLCILGQHY